MNTKEVLALKEKSYTKKIEKTIKDYDECCKKIHILSNRFHWAIIILSVGAILYFNISHHTWIYPILLFLALTSLITLTKREGDKEGYLDGYQVGFDEGINEALGIDEEEQKFLEEIKTDPDLYKIHMTDKEADEMKIEE